MIREQLEERMLHALPTAFGFYLDRCDRVVNGALARVRPALEAPPRGAGAVPLNE